MGWQAGDGMVSKMLGNKDRADGLTMRAVIRVYIAELLDDAGQVAHVGVVAGEENG